MKKIFVVVFALLAMTFSGCSIVATIEQMNAEAQFNFGWCYFNGDDATKDRAEVAELYRRAAEQGNANAQCTLGWCYYNGDGVKKNHAEAVKWYRQAAKQGEQRAKKALQRLGETW